MKRRFPALAESKRPYSAPRVSVFLHRTNPIIDAYARHSLLKVSSGKIEAGLGPPHRALRSPPGAWQSAFCSYNGSSIAPRVQPCLYAAWRLEEKPIQRHPYEVSPYKVTSCLPKANSSPGTAVLPSKPEENDVGRRVD